MLKGLCIFGPAGKGLGPRGRGARGARGPAAPPAPPPSRSFPRQEPAAAGSVPAALGSFMNNVREIERLNALELRQGLCAGYGASWHDQYRNSAWIFVGGLAGELTEGDIICVFSQFGEVDDVNLVRDEEGKSRRFAFLKYEDQRSAVLAVDNLNGALVAGLTVRVDHV